MFYGLWDDESFDTLLPLRFGYMHEFAQRYFGERMSTAGWCTVILRNCGNDEKTALDKFFEMFEIFKNLKITSCRRILLTDENIHYHETRTNISTSVDGKKKSQYPNAQVFYDAALSDGMGHIYVVEYGEDNSADHGIYSQRFVEETAARLFGPNLHWEDCPCENLPLKPPRALHSR